MDPRLQTLLVATLSGGAGLIAGAQLGDAETIADGDRILHYIGSTAVAHAIDLRKSADASVAMTVYGTVRDSDGGVHDLNGSPCLVSAAEQARLATLMQSVVVRQCAQGVSGIPLAQLRIHAVDLRRQAKETADGGAEVFSTLQAYGHRIRALSDGGSITDYPPSGTCAVPDAGARIFDVIGLDCFRKAQGLGK